MGAKTTMELTTMEWNGMTFVFFEMEVTIGYFNTRS
jgi:hypothetical protein